MITWKAGYGLLYQSQYMRKIEEGSLWVEVLVVMQIVAMVIDFINGMHADGMAEARGLRRWMPL